MSDIEGKIARVDCNAARVAGASTGSASDQGKVTRVGASEWSRQAARDIDGKTDRSNGAFWKSDIEGKAAMGSGERAGKRTSFKWAGAHESMRAASEFQIQHPRIPHWCSSVFGCFCSVP